MNNYLQKKDWESIFSLIKLRNLNTDPLHLREINKVINSVHLSELIKKFPKFEMYPDIKIQIENIKKNSNINEYIREYVEIIDDKISLHDAVPQIIKMLNALSLKDISLKKCTGIFTSLSKKFPETLDIYNETLIFSSKRNYLPIEYLCWAAMVTQGYKENKVEYKIPQWINQESSDESAYYLNEYNTMVENISLVHPFFKALKLCDKEQVRGYLLKNKDNLSHNIEFINFIKENFNTSDIYEHKKSLKLSFDHILTLTSSFNIDRNDLCVNLNPAFNRYSDYIDFFISSIESLSPTIKCVSKNLLTTLRDINFSITKSLVVNLYDEESFSVKNYNSFHEEIEKIKEMVVFFQNKLPQINEDILIKLLNDFDKKLPKEKHLVLNEAFDIVKSFEIYQEIKKIKFDKDIKEVNIKFKIKNGN